MKRKVDRSDVAIDGVTSEERAFSSVPPTVEPVPLLSGEIGMRIHSHGCGYVELGQIYGADL